MFGIAASVRGAFPQIGNAAASQTILYGWSLQMWHAIVTNLQPTIQILFSEKFDYNSFETKGIYVFFSFFLKVFKPFYKVSEPMK